MFRHGIIPAFVCALVFTTVATRLFAGPIPNPVSSSEKDLLKPDAGDDGLRKLLKERYNCAVAELAIPDARRPNEIFMSVNLRAACNARYRQAEVALEIFDKPEEQVHILQKLRVDAENLEKWATENMRAGSLEPPNMVMPKPQDLYRTRECRLDIEIMLVKVKQKARPAK